MEETGAMVEPAFMKSLAKSYLMRAHAKKRVFQHKNFYKYLMKVFKWKNQIKEEIRGANVVDEPKPMANVDIIRRNLWMMIVRKEILPAQRRRANFRHEKLRKSKMAAHRCQSHFNLTSRRNQISRNSHNQTGLNNHNNNTNNNHINNITTLTPFGPTSIDRLSGSRPDSYMTTNGSSLPPNMIDKNPSQNLQVIHETIYI